MRQFERFADWKCVVECYCGEEKREVTCGSERAQTDKYSCLKICGKPLACGNHTCTQPCHGGSCMPCSTSPEVVSTCNCGKTKLSDLKEAAARISCLDEIPCCQEKCGKILKCGTRSELLLLNFNLSIQYRCSFNI